MTPTRCGSIPAGLAHLAGEGRTELLFDIAYVAQGVDHARIDSGENRLASVSNQQSGSAIPTVAATLGARRRLAAPYAGLHRYADDGPQRYASASLAGSAFIYITFGAAYRVTDRLRIGATVSDVVSKVVARLVVSGCPGQTVCAPEDPDFDALVQDTQTDCIAPSGSIGLQYDVARTATLGLALQAPSRVSATGTFATRLPRSAFFEGAAWSAPSQNCHSRSPQRFASGSSSGAAPTGYVSVLTVDSAKHLLGIGGGYEAGGWPIGASLGGAILADVQVSLAAARVPQPTPIRISRAR